MNFKKTPLGGVPLQAESIEQNRIWFDKFLIVFSIDFHLSALGDRKP